MFGTVLIEIMISLFFTFAVLALVCTAINETIALVLKSRSKMLFREISRIIGDSEVFETFWKCGLTRSLCKAPSPDGRVTETQAPEKMDRLIFAQSLLEAMEAKSDAPSSSDKLDIAALAELVDDRSILHSVLKSLADNALQTKQEIVTGLADWYDEVMAAATVKYKRHLQSISFAVAAALVTALNADSFALSKALWKDDNLRITYAAMVRAELEDDSTFAALLKPEPLTTDRANRLTEFAEETLRPLPFGWPGNWDTPTLPDRKDGLGALLALLLAYVSKVLGLLITAIAVSLGAPFWFELLDRITGRSKPNKPQEPQEPKQPQ